VKQCDRRLSVNLLLTAAIGWLLRFCKAGEVQNVGGRKEKGEKQNENKKQRKK